MMEEINKPQKGEKEVDDPYLSEMNSELNEDKINKLLNSPEFSRKLNEQMQEMKSQGKSDSQIVSELVSNLGSMAQKGQLLSRKGYDKEEEFKLNPEDIKANYEEKITREKEQTQILEKMINDGGEGIDKEFQERNAILDILNDHTHEHSQSFVKGAQKSMFQLNEKIEKARSEFKDLLKDNQHDLMINEEELDSAMQYKTVQELAQTLPEDQDAIKYTLQELDFEGDKEFEVLIDNKGEANVEKEGEGMF
jgi:hypothetical protein